MKEHIEMYASRRQGRERMAGCHFHLLSDGLDVTVLLQQTFDSCARNNEVLMNCFITAVKLVQCYHTFDLQLFLWYG
jgi:threonine dehydratase